jgi:hypothetical protein
MLHSELVVVRLDPTLNRYNDLSYQDKGRVRLRFCDLFPERLSIYADLYIYIHIYLSLFRLCKGVSKRLVGFCNCMLYVQNCMIVYCPFLCRPLQRTPSGQFCMYTHHSIICKSLNTVVILSVGSFYFVQMEKQSLNVLSAYDL